MIDQCSECGAPRTTNQSCRDHFDQMLVWEYEDPIRWEVHHLMVLCYHLQHPSLYSAEGLAVGRQLLADFIERGLSTESALGENRERVNSGKRDWSITARPGNQGAYERPITWTMTAVDVVAAGADRYIEQVSGWAHSLHQDLTHQQ